MDKFTISACGCEITSAPDIFEATRKAEELQDTWGSVKVVEKATGRVWYEMDGGEVIHDWRKSMVK